MHTTRRAVAALALGGALTAMILTGCGDDDGSADDTAAVTADALLGRAFQATSVTGESLVDDTTFELAFEQEGLVANAGCNTMRGTYDVEGDVLVVEDLAQTMMGCPPDLQAQDDWVAALLTGRPSVELGDATLTLATDDVTVVFDE